MGRARPALALVVVWLLTGCIASVESPAATESPASRTSTTSAGGAAPSSVPTVELPDSRVERLRIGLVRDPSSIDPAQVSDASGRMVVDALFDSLTRVASDLRSVEPSAATTWQVSDDGLTWRFTLDPRGTWHDGRQVVAQDFVRGLQWVAGGADGQSMFNSPLLEYVVGHPSAAAGRAALRGVDAPDPRTVRIRLRWPVDDLPALLADPVLAPRPLTPPGSTEAVGNGPFRLSEPWARNQYLRLQRFGAHPSPPLLDELVFVVYATADGPALAVQDFGQGVLDVSPVPAVSRDDVVAVHGLATPPQSSTGPGVIDVTPLTTTWLGFNTDRRPWDRGALRRAVARLVDAPVPEGGAGLGLEPASGILPPSLPGQSLRCTICSNDEASAARLLDLHADILRETLGSRPINIVVPRGHPGTTAVTALRRALISQLEDVLGVAPDVRVDVLDPTDLADALRGGDHDLHLVTWQATWPTPAGMLVPVFHGRHIGSTNFGRVEIPAVDAALEALAAAPGDEPLDGDVAAWRALELDLEQRALVVPMWWHREAVVVASNVVGYTVAPTGAVDLTVVSVQEQ